MACVGSGFRGSVSDASALAGIAGRLERPALYRELLAPAPRGALRELSLESVDGALDALAGAGEDAGRLEDAAQRCAGEGVALPGLLAAANAATETVWQGLLRVAREEEASSVLTGVEVLAAFAARAAAVVGRAHAREGARLAIAEDANAQALFDSLIAGDSLDNELAALAARLGVGGDGELAPFVATLAAAGASASALAALALRLRGERVLAIAGEDFVSGLVRDPAALSTVDPAELICIGSSVPAGDLGEALGECVLLCGLAAGRSGVVHVADHVPELLLARSPHLAGELHTRVLGPLAGPDHDALLQTLDRLLVHDGDRQATADELQIHRNTLGNRLARISELTAIDAASSRDMLLVSLGLLGAEDGHGDS